MIDIHPFFHHLVVVVVGYYSCFLERVLKKDREFDRYCGDLVEVKLYKAAKGQKIMQGYLKGYDKSSLYIDIKGDEKVIDRKEIALVKRVYIF